MDQSVIVFILASAASYYPVYWCLKRLAGRRRAISRFQTVVHGQDAKTQFLEFLRREAIGRVDAPLSDVLAETMRTTKAAGAGSRRFDHTTLSRLHDTRRMLSALFSVEATAAFDTVLMAVERATPSRAKDAYDEIVGFTSRLSRGL